jgi:hypothetical protein
MVTVGPPSLGVKMTSRVEAPVRQDEAILDYSPATRSYRYTIDGGLPVATTGVALRRARRQRRPDRLGVELHGLDAA